VTLFVDPLLSRTYDQGHTAAEWGGEAARLDAMLR